jgi:type VI protein secretion system component Hcp
MADEVRDALMKFVIKGVPVPAESSSAIAADDDLAKGFDAASADNKWTSNFFQLRSFKMEMGLLGDTAGDPAAIERQQKERTEMLMQSFKEGEDEMKLGATRGASDFATFMNTSPGGSMKSYSSNLESVVLTKLLDISSLTLFKACINSTTIDSASLIKRRGGGGKQLATYLRIDFNNLLITDFNWDEDDVVTEKLTFVCRTCNVRYRMEQSSGKLSASLPTQSWSVINLKG